MYGGLPTGYSEEGMDSLMICNSLLNHEERTYIRQAARLADAGNHAMAERARELAGYGEADITD